MTDFHFVNRASSPRTRVHVRWLTALCVGAFLFSATAAAHRGHGAWSDVTWVTDRFEIIHRMHLADAIELLNGIAPDVVIDSIEGQARLALYVEARFTILDSGGAAVPIETIGAEIDDDFLLVYQEWQPESPPAIVPTFMSRVLFEIDPTAQRFVRYEVGDQITTQQLALP